MNRYIKKFVAILAVLMLVLSACALAEGVISTTVVMRVSHMTQNAVVDVGEDLSMEVNINGVDPSSYQWYFEDAPISGADQKVYSIVNAQVEDSGVYRMDAFDEIGKMLVSMDISARVIDNTVPKSGDASMPVGAAAAMFVAAAATLVLVFRRREKA
ncbi:MAG: immunoglobulin domain-containing protein [Clostridia bacterium]|nr:immunoglobulin domain-containing protein [Clostridia bacterium]